jgi:hypothetical protein
MGKTETLSASVLSILLLSATGLLNANAEAEFKEKHGVWDPRPELTITSPYVPSRAVSNKCTMGMGIGQPNARVNLYPMPESTLSPCHRLWI